MSLILRPPGEQETLPARLAGLGRSRRRTEMTTGWFHLLAILIVALLISCALDFALHLPAVVRCGLLVGTLVAIGVCFLRGVRAPSRQSTHPLSIAMLLEEKFPKLNDALASAVDFLTAQSGNSERSNPHRFRDVAVLRAQNLASRLDIDSIVPTRPMWTSIWMVAIMLVVALPVAFTNPARSKMAVMRFVDPLGEHNWPTKTQIEVLEPLQRQSRLAKGDPFPIVFKLSGVMPEHATVLVRLSGAAVVEDLVPVSVEAGQADARLEFRIDGGRIPRDFDFQIVANDAQTPWYRVTVAPAPKLVPLDDRPSPQVHLTYPAYTELSPVQLPDGTGVVEAVAGTVIQFRAASDVRIKHAVFRPQFDQTPILTATGLAALATHNPFGAMAAQLLADSATQDIPVTISGDEGTILDARFTPHQAGLYALRFTDETDLTGVRFFDFRLFPDPTPSVLLEHPAARIDPLTYLPTATLSVQARAEDRPFAVKNLVLEYRVGGADAPFQILPLEDLEVAGETLPALVGTMVGIVRPKPVTMEAIRKIPLSKFTKLNGAPLADGDIITLRAACWDWDDCSVLKEPGRSKDVEIRILNKSSLEAQFQRELAALRPELLRLKEEQRDTRSKTDELAKAAEVAPLKPEEMSQLAQVESTQKQVRNKIADPTDGIRAKVDQLRETATANNLQRSTTTAKMEAVANELNRLADQHLENAEQPLTTAKQEAEKGNEGQAKGDPKKVADLLKNAAKQQKAAQESFENLLERLEQWGGAGEVRGEARSLKDQIARAAEQTKKATENVPQGKPADQLNPAEKAELAKPADKLDQTAEQSANLLAKATRLADQKEAQAKAAKEAAAMREKAAEASAAEAKSQPAGSQEAADAKAAADALNAEANAMKQSAAQAQAEADALRKAVKESGGESLPNDIREAAKSTRENQPGDAENARQNALDRLDKLADSLTETPSQGNDELQKKRKAATDQIDKLADEQDELRKKTKQAEAIPDEAKREEELKKLATEQEQLRRKAEQMLQRLTREQMEPAADAVRKAAEQMQDARDQLEQGKAATEKQEETLDKLDEALKKLDQEKQQDQDQLSREKREELAELLKALREKQKATIDEAVRLQETAKKAQRWERPVLKSLDDLQEREKALADEVRQFAEKNFAELPVFNKLAGQAADSMKRAAKYIGERREEAGDFDAKFDLEVEKAADERTGKPMTTALRRLDQILNSLKEDPKAKAKNGGGEQPMPMPMEGGGGEGGGMPPGGGGGIPQLAQLKALRAMQAEVNERTAEFAKAHPNNAKLTDDDHDDLKELEQAQRDVAELFEKLAEAFQKSPELP